MDNNKTPETVVEQTAAIMITKPTVGRRTPLLQ